jgi:hypothetical protein
MEEAKPNGRTNAYRRRPAGRGTLTYVALDLMTERVDDGHDGAQGGWAP